MSDNERVQMTAEQRQIAAVLMDRKQELEARFQREIVKVNRALVSLAATVWRARAGGPIPAGMRPRFKQEGRDVYVELEQEPPLGPTSMPIPGPPMGLQRFEEFR